MQNLKSIKSKGGFLNGLGTMFALPLILSLFLVLQVVGCGGDSNSDDGDNDNDKPVSFVVVSGGNTYLLQTTTAMNGKYTFQYNDDIISQGTISKNPDTDVIKFKSDGSSGGNADPDPAKKRTSNAVYLGGLSIGSGILETTTFDLNLDDPTVFPSLTNPLKVPTLVCSKERVFREGLTNAPKNGNTASYIYISLPKQVKLLNDEPTFSPKEDSIEHLEGSGNKTYTSLQLQLSSASRVYHIGKNWLKQGFVEAHTDPKQTAWPDDPRSLYSYLIVSAADGYTSGRDRNDAAKGVGCIPDLSWDDEFEHGYITTLADSSGLGGRTVFEVKDMGASDQINYINPKGSNKRNVRNVKGAQHIFAMRTINVQLGEPLDSLRTNLVRIQTGATKKRSFTRGKSDLASGNDYHYIIETTVAGKTAIKVDTNFITRYVTATIGTGSDAKEKRSYAVIGLDGVPVYYSWEEIQKAYFIPGDEIISVYNGNTEVLTKRVKYPVTIVIQGTVFFPKVPYHAANAGENPPAFAAVYR